MILINVKIVKNYNICYFWSFVFFSDIMVGVTKWKQNQQTKNFTLIFKM